MHLGVNSSSSMTQRSPHLGFLEHDSRPQQAPYPSLVAHHISTYRSSTSGQKNGRSAQSSSYNSWKQLSKWNLLNSSPKWRERCLRRHVCARRAAVRSRIPLTCDRCTRLLCAKRGSGGATCFAICLADAVQNLGTIDPRCIENGAYYLPESYQDFVSR